MWWMYISSVLRLVEMFIDSIVVTFVLFIYVALFEYTNVVCSRVINFLMYGNM
jgi:hypothetical protein